MTAAVEAAEAVTKSVTPRGVEHALIFAAGTGGVGVTKSVTPRGVEHWIGGSLESSRTP